MQVSEEAVAQGRLVMEQAAEQLRQILREGNLLMLPVLPGTPPDRSAAPEELAAFERAALQLSSIAALAGLPQARFPCSCGFTEPPLRTMCFKPTSCVISLKQSGSPNQQLPYQSFHPTESARKSRYCVKIDCVDRSRLGSRFWRRSNEERLVQVCIPVHVPGQPPASVAVVGLQRSDMRLLAAAEKLGPMITDAAVKLAAAQQRNAAGAANGTSAGAATSPQRPTANGTAKRAAGPPPPLPETPEKYAQEDGSSWIRLQLCYLHVIGAPLSLATCIVLPCNPFKGPILARSGCSSATGS